jgi:glutamate carboxypeptidase
MPSDTLEALHRYTLCESPTGDARALAALAEILDADAARAGFHTARETHPTGDHLIWTLPARGVTGDPILLLSHYDTVWPVGTLDHLPWTVDGDVIRGPGVYDTKAGIAALLSAAETIKDQPHPGVRVIVVADEEVGSPTAGDLVRAEAARARAVFGLEPPHPGGDLKTGRRGSTRARIEVTGVEAHAALDPDAGANAIDELIDQLIRLRSAVASRPVLMNTGTIAGGIGQNIDGRPADGAADTNTTGALGRPTVDGLAPRGGGAHARTEWVSAAGIAERTALLAALLTSAIA